MGDLAPTNSAIGAERMDWIQGYMDHFCGPADIMRPAVVVTNRKSFGFNWVPIVHSADFGKWNWLGPTDLTPPELRISPEFLKSPEGEFRFQVAWALRVYAGGMARKTDRAFSSLMYALLFVAMFFGGTGSRFGLPAWVAITLGTLGAVCCFVFLFRYGRTQLDRHRLETLKVTGDLASAVASIRKASRVANRKLPKFLAGVAESSAERSIQRLEFGYRSLDGQFDSLR